MEKHTTLLGGKTSSRGLLLMFSKSYISCMLCGILTRGVCGCVVFEPFFYLNCAVLLHVCKKKKEHCYFNCYFNFCLLHVSLTFVYHNFQIATMGFQLWNHLDHSRWIYLLLVVTWTSLSISVLILMIDILASKRFL